MIARDFSLHDILIKIPLKKELDGQSGWVHELNRLSVCRAVYYYIGCGGCRQQLDVLLGPTKMMRRLITFVIKTRKLILKFLCLI